LILSLMPVNPSSNQASLMPELPLHVDGVAAGAGADGVHHGRTVSCTINTISAIFCLLPPP
jgi:hypothetical protein